MSPEDVSSVPQSPRMGTKPQMGHPEGPDHGPRADGNWGIAEFPTMVVAFCPLLKTHNDAQTLQLTSQKKDSMSPLQCHKRHQL